MKLSDLIEARLEPVLYHYISAHHAAEMITTGRIQFGIASGTKSDNDYQRGYPYYLSCARVPYGEYAAGANVATQIEFNRNWFAQRFKIVPIDYWGKMGKVMNKFEYEDRILSKKPEVRIDPKQAIRAIHQLVKPGDDWGRRWIRKLVLAAKTNQIPVHVYTDKNAFYRADTSQSVPLDQAGLLTPDKEPPLYSSRVSRKWLSKYKEFIFKKSVSELSPEARKILPRFTMPYYERDMINSLEADIHNGRSMHREETAKFVQAIHSIGARTVKEFYDAMSAKWTKLEKDHEAQTS